MRYSDLNIDDVQNKGFKIINELDQDNEYKTDIINEHLLNPPSIQEGIVLKQTLLSLKNLPEDNASISEVKRLTEKAFKIIQDKYISGFERAISFDEIQDKKEDRLETSFIEWANRGANLDIPYTKLAAKALNIAHEQYRDYVLDGYFSLLPKEPTYSTGKDQYHSIEDINVLTKYVIQEGFNYPERIDSLISINNFVKDKYSYDEDLVKNIENNIGRSIAEKDDIKLIFELSEKSPDNIFNIKSKDVNFDKHIENINKEYKNVLETIPGFNKKNYSENSMKEINQLVKSGLFDEDITYFQFLGIGLNEASVEEKNKKGSIANIYDKLPSQEMKDSLEKAVSNRDYTLIIEFNKAKQNDNTPEKTKRLKF